MTFVTGWWTDLNSEAPPPARVRPTQPAEPLWRRVPTRDASGRCLSDFMMIIPGLNRRSPAELKFRLIAIQRVLGRYPESIVFAELNLKLNTLWVTLKPISGLGLQIAMSVKLYVPEALLVAHKPIQRQS